MPASSPWIVLNSGTAAQPVDNQVDSLSKRIEIQQPSEGDESLNGLRDARLREDNVETTSRNWLMSPINRYITSNKNLILDEKENAVRNA